MGKYIKSYSSYTKRSPHMVTMDGTIYEEDFVTFRDNTLIDNNNVNLSENNFAYTIIPSNNEKKKYNISDWLTPPSNNDEYNDEFWRLSDVLSDEDKVSISLSGVLTAQVSKLNTDISDLSKVSYFGSVSELFNASINNIINKFPSSIYVSPSFSTYSPLEHVVTNPFEIDLNNTIFAGTSNISDMFNNYKNYQIVRSSQQTWAYCSGSTEYNEIILDEDNKENIIYFEQNFINICDTKVLNSVIFTGENGTSITLTYSYHKDAYNNLTTTVKEITAIVNYYDHAVFTGLHIRPNDEYINNFFNNLSDFETYILNRDTSPKYTSYFNIPQETEDGLASTPLSFTWETEDGWNLDIDSTAYLKFIQEISQSATLSDTYDSDNAYRMLTHDAIKNLDYTEKIATNSDEEYNEAYNKISKVIRLYGRNLDEIKKYADAVSFTNNITYDNIENLSNNLFKDYLAYSGIEANSILYSANYKNNNSILLNTNQLYNGYGKKFNSYDVETEFYRRLIVNLPYVLRSKGTKKCIEMIMNLFGVPRSLYDIKQYIYTAELPLTTAQVSEISNLNKTISYTLAGIEYNTEILTYEDEDSVTYHNQDDLHGLCIERDNDGTGVPAFKGNTANLYFQQGGGWYKESLSYLNEVNEISELYSLKVSALYPCIIYYVNNIDKTYLSNYFILKDINNYNNINGWYNVTENEYNGVEINFINEEGETELFAVSINALLNIQDINTGNNPHVGYGRYDRGLDYIWHFGPTNDYNSPSTASLFKYALDNTPICTKNSSWPQYTNLFNYGFNLRRHIDTKRSWYINSNALMVDHDYHINSKSILYTSGNTNINYLNCNKSITVNNNFNTRKVDNFNINNYKLVINTKNVDIVLTEENNDFKEEFYNIILPYVEQVIPATTIFNVLLTYNATYISDFTYFYCSGLNDGYVYAKILKKVSSTNNNIDLDENGNDVTISGLRQSILLDNLFTENPNTYLYNIVGSFNHSDYKTITEEFNPDICPMTGSITIDSGITFLYKVDSGSSKYVSMSATNDWAVYNSPTLVNVLPSSGDSNVTQLLCNRLGWGNDSIILRNTRTHEKVTCNVQCIYLETFYDNAILNNLSFINTGGNYTFNTIVNGGDNIDYNITYSGNSGFTYIKNNNNTITVTAANNIEPNTITGIIRLTHSSNNLVYKEVNLSQAAANIDYNNQWSDYVCEQININNEVYDYTFSWDNHICVKEIGQNISYDYSWKNHICTKYQVIDNNVSVYIDYNIGKVTVNTQYPVDSSTEQLAVTLNITKGNETAPTTVYINSGESQTLVNTSGFITQANIINLAPAYDKKYHYIF